jgi:hypothetical protein
MAISYRGRPPAARPARLGVLRLEDRDVPALLGTTLFPADNPWNQRIADAPVAATSAAVMNRIVTTFGDNRLHPDFGQDTRTAGADLYGIPYNVVHGNSVPRINVVVDGYPDESDLLAAPIPADAVLEGDYQSGPRAGLANRGDSHLLVYDVDNQVAYEFFAASRPSENADGRWHAAQESVWDMQGNTFRPLTWTSADAAGLAILPGLVRPDEALPVSQGGQGVINHAIRFTLTNSVVLNQFVYPASHTANPGNTDPATQPPMGSRFRLKASVDISTLSPQSRAVAQAMKEYGLILADNGSNFFFSGASHSVDAANGFALTFDDADIQSTTTGLKRLRYSDFELVDLTPAVVGLSAAGGAAGDTVTVTGRNFGGAAGHLSVLFGSTPGANVTILSDTQLTVGVPAGSGTLDVRVKSGVDAPGVTQNVTNPIFGYGLSAATAADRFTYATSPPSGNAAPTIAAAASATPSPVTGTTTTLHVLGADDGGEANLRYTWTLVSGPAGAAPVYGTNGTNAARDTTVTLNRAGSYLFQVTATDAGGLSVSSSVTVAVVQTLTSISLTPSSATVVLGGQTRFVALALDQFGVALATQPAFNWTVASGPGTIDPTGLYTVTGKKTGTALIRVSAGGVSATATVKVVRR